MTKPIGLQLYTLREHTKTDFEGTIRRIADMGYVGVETAGFDGTTPQTAAELFKSLGLQVPSAHTPILDESQRDQQLEIANLLGVRLIIAPYIPKEDFETVDGIKRVADRLNAADEVCRANGFQFAYHNHWWEYLPVEGQFAYQLMAQYTNPTVKFQVDTYWVKVAGLEPAAVLRELGDRVPSLHIKDGPATRDAAMTAVGAGVMHFAPIIEAGDAAEWLIVELDRSDSDIFEAVEQSYTYLTKEGLGRGSK